MVDLDLLKNRDERDGVVGDDPFLHLLRVHPYFYALMPKPPTLILLDCDFIHLFLSKPFNSWM